jgi:hypothetical protein
VKLARAFEVYDEILSADVEGSIRARRLVPEHMDFTITFSLVDRSAKQLGTLAAIVERYDLDLDVDDHRLASLK